MNCITLKPQLALAALGDLSSPEQEAVQAHCDQCPACAAELRALRATLQVLTDAGPTAVVGVNVTAIHQAEAQRQARAARRWRRTAFGLSAAAAVVIGILGLSRLEWRWDAQQLVIRWGTPGAVEENKSNVVGTTPLRVQPEEDAERRLARLEQLVLALADDAHGFTTQLDQQQGRDRQTAEAVVQLARQLDDLRHETRRDRAGLYAALNAQAPTKE